MRSLHWRQALPCAWELESQAFKFFEVEGGEYLDPFGTDARETQSDDPTVIGIPSAGDESGGVGTVHETHSAVMAQEEVVGDLADGRTAPIAATPNGQKQLVLGGRQAGGFRLLLAPSFEMAEAGPQPQQAGISVVGQAHSLTISSWYDEYVVLVRPDGCRSSVRRDWRAGQLVCQ